MELRNYYSNLLPEFEQPGYRHPMQLLMDDYDNNHPNTNAYQLKTIQYNMIAEHFKPVLFEHSPFFYEMGLKTSVCDGYPAKNVGGWLFKRNQHLFCDADPEVFNTFCGQIHEHIHLCCGPYIDTQHYCFPMTNVIKNGLTYFYEQADEELKNCINEEEMDFILCAKSGLMAAKHIAEKFADAAEKNLEKTIDYKQQKYLLKIAECARKVPWNKAEHFYEGLNALWFLREVCGVLEGVGNSNLGRPDHLLYELYKHDIESGYLSKEEAYDLIGRFLVTADCHYDKDKTVMEYCDHEIEMGITLGGCDDQGNEVFNELTVMFLKAHRELKLIYPKIHCRFSQNSSSDYLNELNKDFLAGRSILDLINDDCLIQTLIHDGKSLEDARKYVNIGCWDIDVEGMESAPGGCYYNTVKILEMSVHGCSEQMKNLGIECLPLDDSKDFEEVYQKLFKNIITPLRWRCQMIGIHGKIASKVNPLPFFSACLQDCLKNRKDYTNGGARYNPNSIAPIGLPNVIDALLVIQTLCFKEKYCQLNELLNAVRANWHGYEELFQKAVCAPHFGDDMLESRQMAKRLHDDLYDNTRDLMNERGGGFALGYYVYREFRLWAESIKATPDGRHDSEPFAHGITPSRIKRIESISSAVNSIGQLDLTKCAANSVTSVVLPVGKMTLAILEGFERAFAASKLELIQINCVNREDLLDARIHPEKHQDLIVRVCGFSAKFVALSPEWQDEFISRNVYE